MAAMTGLAITKAQGKEFRLWKGMLCLAFVLPDRIPHLTSLRLTALLCKDSMFVLYTFISCAHDSVDVFDKSIDLLCLIFISCDNLE